MTGRRIRMNDGTVYEGSECGYADGFLWCFITGHTLAETAPEFLKAAATERIVFEYGEMTDTYDGYTEIQTMISTADGCNICLKQPAQ